jgi:hypothetical protein
LNGSQGSIPYCIPPKKKFRQEGNLWWYLYSVNPNGETFESIRSESIILATPSSAQTLNQLEQKIPAFAHPTYHAS